MLELEYENKIIQKLLVITEICSWLPPGLDGRKVCSQEHISLITNSFWMILFSYSNSSMAPRLSYDYWYMYNVQSTEYGLA